MNNIFKKAFLVIAFTFIALFVIQINIHADDSITIGGFSGGDISFEANTEVEDEEAARIAADTAETAAREAADAAEKAAREAADQAEKTAREAADDAEEQARKAAIENEAQARILALEMEAALREEQISALEQKNYKSTIIIAIISSLSLVGVIVLFIIKR